MNGCIELSSGGSFFLVIYFLILPSPPTSAHLRPPKTHNPRICPKDPESVMCFLTLAKEKREILIWLFIWLQRRFLPFLQSSSAKTREEEDGQNKAHKKRGLLGVFLPTFFFLFAFLLDLTGCFNNSLTLSLLTSLSLFTNS